MFTFFATLSMSMCPQIVLETSRFVRSNGGQVEVLLKVRQAQNPNFGFLMPDHPIHPYYRYLVDVNPQPVRSGFDKSRSAQVAAGRRKTGPLAMPSRCWTLDPTWLNPHNLTPCYHRSSHACVVLGRVLQEPQELSSVLCLL